MTGLSEETLGRLTGEVERIVSLEGMELVDVEYKCESAGWVLRVFIDRDGGVNLSDCEIVSKQIGMMLDVEDFIRNRYTLEVSSPGLNRRLRKPEDFRRFAGRLVRIKLEPSREGRKKYRGRLSGIDGDVVVLDDIDEGCTHRLSLNEIESARLEIEL
jgi:ribosome maturation factor RimP